MILAKERGSAASVSHTTCDQGNFPVAAFQNQPKPHITDPFPILQSLSNQGKFKNGREGYLYLFFSVLSHPAQNTDDVREVFSVLIRSTLRYRDHVLESKRIVITVEDVRTVLDWLVPSISTGRLPETDDTVRLDLLKLWLDELKYFRNPKAYLN